MKTILSILLMFILLSGTGCTYTGKDESSGESASPLIETQITESFDSDGSITITPAESNMDLTYPIIDTSQTICYDNVKAVACPELDTSFIGQDGQYAGTMAAYQDNGDGTISDLNTGLMWQQDPGEKMTYGQDVTKTASFNLAGYSDWRLPTIKELYSLILFDGTDVSACIGSCPVTPFIDNRYFKFSYGDQSAGERTIDSQFASSTKYVSTTMNGNETMFGVNFADGRIKGYPTNKSFYVLYVRGNPNYGQNDFVDNENGTITDNATDLIWMQSDSEKGMDWQSALAYCESMDSAGYTDWRLPNIKELQSIVDYSRSPSTTNSAAINPMFKVSIITDEAGQSDYPFYWSSTTHASSSGDGSHAAYVSFGKALGYMFEAWLDVHGAGAQRSDPKSGSLEQYATGHGPQGDAVRIENYVRCVRGGNADATPAGITGDTRPTIEIESTGLGQDTANQNGQQNPTVSGPPQEAITACSAILQNEVCEFTTPKGIIAGTCKLIQQQLACVPAIRP